MKQKKLNDLVVDNILKQHKVLQNHKQALDVHDSVLVQLLDRVNVCEREGKRTRRKANRVERKLDKLKKCINSL